MILALLTVNRECVIPAMMVAARIIGAMVWSPLYALDRLYHKCWTSVLRLWRGVVFFAFPMVFRFYTPFGRL